MIRFRHFQVALILLVLILLIILMMYLTISGSGESTPAITVSPITPTSVAARNPTVTATPVPTRLIDTLWSPTLSVSESPYSYNYSSGLGAYTVAKWPDGDFVVRWQEMAFTGPESTAPLCDKIDPLCGQPAETRIRIWSNGSWGPKEQIFGNLSAPLKGSPCDYQTGPNGELHCMVIRGNQLSYSIRTPDGEWTIPEPVASFGGNIFANVAFDSKGTMHVVVEQGSQVESGIEWEFYYIRRDAQGNWSNQERIEVVQTFVESTIGTIFGLLVDHQDTLHLIWMDTGGARWRYTLKKPEEAWMTPSEIIFEPDLHQRFSIVKVDSRGNLHFVWIPANREGGGSNVFYMTKSKGQSFSEPISVSKVEDDRHISFRVPAMDVTKDGRVFVAWSEAGSNYRDEIRYAFRTPDGSWSEPTTIPLDCCPGLEDMEDLEIFEYKVQGIVVSGDSLHLISEARFSNPNNSGESTEILHVFRPL